jgi:hypothetical protein
MGAMIHDAVLGSLTLAQCSQASYQPNAEITRGRSSGAVLAEATFLNKSEPVCSWTTSDLATMLAGIDIGTGLCLSSSTITIPWAVQGCAGDLGSGNHYVISATAGYAHVQSISARQGETATAQVECCLLSTTGYAVPATSVVNGSLASQTFVSEFRLGLCKINSTTVTGVTGVQINTGISYEKRTNDGGIYPNHTFLGEVNPTVDITFENQAVANTYGTVFTTMTNGYIYLRKKAAGSTVVADATAGHIGISFGGGIITVEQVSGQGRTPAEVTLRLHGFQLSVSTATAIS